MAARLYSVKKTSCLLDLMSVMLELRYPTIPNRMAYFSAIAMYLVFARMVSEFAKQDCRCMLDRFCWVSLEYPQAFSLSCSGES